jgi:carboxylesterase
MKLQWSPLVAALVMAVPGYLLFKPLDIENLKSNPRPVRSYAEAVQRVEDLRSREPADTNPACSLQFLTQGRKVKRAIVFVHGYTNCPNQFLPLGRAFNKIGYNVLIAPLPHHGLSERMTIEHELLTAEELVSYADEMVDIAQGLGEKVTMVGISAGGVTAACAAQFRSDLDAAVIISPAFGFDFLPASLTRPATNFYLTLPNYFEWWDASRKADGTPDHSYPRYSSHALAQILRLGYAVRDAAEGREPAARAITIITNGNDRDINADLVDAIADKWSEGSAILETFEFPADLNLGHDLIDPAQTNQRIDIVYPRLMELIGRSE